jgi:hypothetical protein
VLFVAHDKRAPRVRLRTRQLDTLAMCRIAVVVDSWSVHSRWPDGHYVRTLGNTGDKAAETEVLLIENDINTAPFTDDVYRCVYRSPPHLPPPPSPLLPGWGLGLRSAADMSPNTAQALSIPTITDCVCHRNEMSRMECLRPGSGPEAHRSTVLSSL